MLGAIFWLAEVSITLFLLLPVLKRPNHLKHLYPVLRRLVNFTGMSIGLVIPTSLYLVFSPVGFNSPYILCSAFLLGVFGIGSYIWTLVKVKTNRNNQDGLNLKALTWVVTAEFTSVASLFTIMFV